MKCAILISMLCYLALAGIVSGTEAGGMIPVLQPQRMLLRTKQPPISSYRKGQTVVL